MIFLETEQTENVKEGRVGGQKKFISDKIGNFFNNIFTHNYPILFTDKGKR
jgi:hypothetical protein